MSYTNCFTKLCIMTVALLLSSGIQAQKLLVPVPLAPPDVQPSSQGLKTEATAEPERWTKEDLTLDEQYSTAKKEAQAAFHEAKNECLSGNPTVRTDCLIQAKSELDREMAAINKRFGLPE